jgi:hypothetical protein
MSRADQNTIATTRLRNHSLLTAKFATPADAVRALGALQGQDFPGVKWSIAQRCSATVTEVDAAFDSAQLVRSWPFRGTLHVVAAEDLCWMIDLTAQRTLQGLVGRHRQLGLDSETFVAARRTAERVLGGGRRLSRDEFLRALNTAGIATDGQRGAHLLLVLCQRKLVCFGPTNGTGQSVVLLEEWIGNPTKPEPEHAVALLAERYFRSHGPATLADFVWWSKLKIVEARAGIAAADGLRRVTLAGEDYWLAAELDLETPILPVPRVILLSGFDEYLLGYRDRSAVLAPEHSDRIVPGGNGMFFPTIVSKGRVIGTWRKKLTSRSVSIETDPFSALGTTDRTALGRAATGYAAYLGRTIESVQ